MRKSIYQSTSLCVYPPNIDIFSTVSDMRSGDSLLYDGIWRSLASNKIYWKKYIRALKLTKKRHGLYLVYYEGYRKFIQPKLY